MRRHILTEELLQLPVAVACLNQGQGGIYISEMMSAGQRSQVMLSHPHIKVSPPLVAGHPSDAHFTLALV